MTLPFFGHVASGLRAFARGFFDQLRATLLVRRSRLMLLLVVLSAILSMAIYTELVVQKIPTVVVDLDGSQLSRTVRMYLGSAPELDVLPETVQSVEQARNMLVSGDVNAIVVLPSDLSSNIKRAKKGQVWVVVDSSNILTGRNALKAIVKAVGTVSAGVQLSVVGKLGERKSAQMARVIPIAIEDHPSFNPAANYAVYLSPMVVFFLLHVYLLISAASLYLPNYGPPRVASKAGAMLAVWTIGMLLGAMFLFAFFPLQHLVAMASPHVALALMGLWIAVDILMAAAFMRLIPAPVMALEVVIVLAMLSLMFSGLTWPTDMFPPILQRISAFIPFTPFIRALTMLLQSPVKLIDIRKQLYHLGFHAALYTSILICAVIFRFAYHKSVHQLRKRLS